MTERKSASPSTQDLIHRRAAELLADGQWHEFERLLRELMRLVPPGPAIRKAEQRRREASSRPTLERPARIRPDEVGPRNRERAVEAQIENGARDIVREAIANAVAYEIQLEDPSEAGPQRRRARVRLVGVSNTIKGDRRRAEIMQPVLDSLAQTFRKGTMEWCYEQVRLAAHESGFHLSSCPAGCSLIGSASQKAM